MVIILLILLLIFSCFLVFTTSCHHKNITNYEGGDKYNIKYGGTTLEVIKDKIGYGSSDNDHTVLGRLNELIANQGDDAGITQYGLILKKIIENKISYEAHKSSLESTMNNITEKYKLLQRRIQDLEQSTIDKNTQIQNTNEEIESNNSEQEKKVKEENERVGTEIAKLQEELDTAHNSVTSEEPDWEDISKYFTLLDELYKELNNGLDLINDALNGEIIDGGGIIIDKINEAILKYKLLQEEINAKNITFEELNAQLEVIAANNQKELEELKESNDVSIEEEREKIKAKVLELKAEIGDLSTQKNDLKLEIMQYLNDKYAQILELFSIKPCDITESDPLHALKAITI